VICLRKHEEHNRRLSVLVLEMLQELSYGTVTIIVQDGKIIQVEKTEKIRL